MEQSCPRCGTSGLPPEARFCGSCLAPLEEETIELPERDAVELVGRRPELARLVATARRVVTGVRRLAELRGEPGSGRRRLVEETLRSLPLSTPVHRTRCRGEAIPFGPWRDLLRSWQPPDRSGRELARSTLAQLTAKGSAGRDSFAVRALRAVSTWLLEGHWERESYPVVLIFQDVDVADSASLQLLDRLLAENHFPPLLILTTARPDFRASWSTPQNVERVDVPLLAWGERRDLAHRWLANARAAAPLVALVVERAGGNPGAIEHVARALAEGDAELRAAARIEGLLIQRARWRLPGELSEILKTRLASLGPHHRWLLGAAAVVARPCSAALLHRLGPDAVPQEHLGQALEALVRRGLLQPAEGDRYELVDEATRDAAFELMGRGERTEIHRIYADLLEEGQEAEQAAVIARHQEDAGEPDRAAAHYARAGSFALDVGAYPEAAGHLRRAWALHHAGAPIQPADHAALGLRYATALAALDRPREAGAVLDTVDPTDFSSSDLVSAGALFIQGGWITFDNGRRPAEARERIERGLALIDGKPEAETHTGLALAYLCRIESLDGRTAQALFYADRLAAEATAIGNTLGQVVGLVYGADARCNVGQLERAEEDVEYAIRIADAARDDLTIAFAYQYATKLYFLRREADRALEVAERARRAAHSVGDQVGLLASVDIWTGFAYLLRGEAHLALQAFGSMAQRAPDAPASLDMLARGKLETGAYDDAIHLASRALEGEPVKLVQIRARRTLGLALARRQPRQLGDAEREARHSLELAERLGLRPYAADAHVALAEIAWHAGDTKRAGEQLAAANEIHRSCGMQPVPSGFFDRIAAAKA